MIGAAYCGAAQKAYTSVFPSGWTYKDAIVVPHSLVTANLAAGVPFCFNAALLSIYGLNSRFWSDVQSGGGDIRFSSDAAGAYPLHFQVVKISTGSTIIQVWVNMPALSSSADTTIYIWYGNALASMPAATDTTFGSNGVWDTYYDAVYHLEGTGGETDSTANSYSMTAPDGTPSSVAGQVDNGRSGFGALAYPPYTQTFLQRACIGETGAHTIGAWLKYVSNSDQQEIFTNSSWNTWVNAGYGQYDLFIDSSGHVCLQVISRANPMLGTTNSITYKCSTALTDGNIYSIFATNDGSLSSPSGSPPYSTGVNIWINGVAQTLTATISGAPVVPATSNCGYTQIGLNENGPNDLYPFNFNGWIDEVSLAHIVRSSDWIKTVYNNQNTV